MQDPTNLSEEEILSLLMDGEWQRLGHGKQRCRHMSMMKRCVTNGLVTTLSGTP